MDCSNNVENKKEPDNNAQKKASCGGFALLSGFAMLICIALTVYHYEFISKFEEDGQIMSLKSPSNMFTELMQKYIKLWVKYLGDTPSTVVLAFLIPISIVVICLFIYYTTKYFDYYKAEKAIERENKNALLFELKNEIIKENTADESKPSEINTEDRKDSNDDKPSV